MLSKVQKSLNSIIWSTGYPIWEVPQSSMDYQMQTLKSINQESLKIYTHVHDHDIYYNICPIRDYPLIH